MGDARIEIDDALAGRETDAPRTIDPPPASWFRRPAPLALALLLALAAGALVASVIIGRFGNRSNKGGWASRKHSSASRQPTSFDRIRRTSRISAKDARPAPESRCRPMAVPSCSAPDVEIVSSWPRHLVTSAQWRPSSGDRLSIQSSGNGSPVFAGWTVACLRLKRIRASRSLRLAISGSGSQTAGVGRRGIRAGVGRGRT